MRFRLTYLAILAAAIIPTVASARQADSSDTGPPRAGASLTLIEEALADADEDDDSSWRLSGGMIDPPRDDPQRLRIKLRPNRAMGRMSFSF